LPDGRQLMIPLGRIRPILVGLLDLFATGAIDSEAKRIGLSRASAADLAELEHAACKAGLVWRGGKSVRALGKQLRRSAGIPAATVPKSFGAELRPYQERGVDWLQFLRAAGLGGVLADDMGLTIKNPDARAESG
jgi:hypothetical protein